MKNNREQWLLIAYETYAKEGPTGLKIESLAKKVGISKSTFYHYFSDLELFTDELMHLHTQRATLIAHKERQAQRIDPDLFVILLDHQTDLFFHRQLRFHQETVLNRQTLEKTNEIIGVDFIHLWMRDQHFNLPDHQLKSIYEMALESFFMQLNESQFNSAWLQSFFYQMNSLALQMKP